MRKYPLLSDAQMGNALREWQRKGDGFEMLARYLHCDKGLLYAVKDGVPDRRKNSWSKLENHRERLSMVLQAVAHGHMRIERSKTGKGSRKMLVWCDESTAPPPAMAKVCLTPVGVRVESLPAPRKMPKFLQPFIERG